MSSTEQPQNPTPSSSSPSPLYPAIDTTGPGEPTSIPHNVTSQPYEEILVRIPGAIVHLISTDNSLEIACGDLSIVALCQGHNVISVLVRVGNDIQWPLAKDEAVVKLDDTHYFFTLRVPVNSHSFDDEHETDEVLIDKVGELEMLNYGLTIAAKGQDARLLINLDQVLERYSCFKVEEVKEIMGNWEMVGRNVSPEELESEGEKRDLMADNSAAYWTTLAPNVEEYSGCVSRLIAAGSGQLIRGILWCGDVTVDRFRCGNDFLKKRLGSSSCAEVSPGVMKRIERVKKMTKMSEKLATGVLSGVVKVSGFVTSSIVNSTVGKKFFSLLPGEILLASLDGFSKVCDAVEVAGKNVMSTTSVVTTGLVSQRYGEQAALATTEALDAAGHAFGTAWAVFKIRKAINPKSVLKPTTLVKAAAEANSSGLRARSNKDGS